MKKRGMALLLAASMLLTMGVSACGKKWASSETKETGSAGAQEETEVQVFIAASLSQVMEDLAERFNKDHPEVKLVFNADSSGKLMTQIEEGYNCDIFFSAAQDKMDQLEKDGLLVENTRKDVVNNTLVLICPYDVYSEAKGLTSLEKAEDMALADGSVPAGKYTRQALVNLGILPETEDVSKITTQEVSEALGHLKISEQDNVSKVLTAVEERSCSVGTVYYSDTYGHEGGVTILERISHDLTGDITYPIARVVNDKADDAENAAADAFYEYVTSDDAKKVFDKYYFDTDLND